MTATGPYSTTIEVNSSGPASGPKTYMVTAFVIAANGTQVETYTVSNSNQATATASVTASANAWIKAQLSTNATGYNPIVPGAPTTPVGPVVPGNGDGSAPVNIPVDNWGSGDDTSWDTSGSIGTPTQPVSIPDTGWSVTQGTSSSGDSSGVDFWDISSSPFDYQNASSMAFGVSDTTVTQQIDEDYGFGGSSSGGSGDADFNPGPLSW